MATVLFFAQLKEDLNCEKLDVQVNHSMSIAELKLQLSDKGENWHQAFSKPNLMAAINHEMVNEQAIVHSNDEVAFFPPVTGG